MGNGGTFVAIVLGARSEAEADRIAAAAGSASVLRPGDDGSAGPQLAVVIDAADVTDAAGLQDVVQSLLIELEKLTATSPGSCVVASHPVTDTLKVVDDAGVLLGTADRDGYRWVSTAVAGPLTMLTSAVSAVSAVSAAGVVAVLSSLVEQGQQVRAVRA